MSNVTQSQGQHNAWIERLFIRLAAMYGTQWTQRWADVPIEVVKAEWERALSRHSRETLQAALDACSEHSKFPPSLPEFMQLCRESIRMPANEPVERRPRISVDCTKSRAEIAKLISTSRLGLGSANSDPKDWARRILKEAGEGTYTRFYGLRCAKEALGIGPEAA